MINENSQLIELKTLLEETKCITEEQFTHYYSIFRNLESKNGFRILGILNSELLEELKNAPINSTSPTQENLTLDTTLFTNLKNVAQTATEAVATKLNNLIEFFRASLYDIQQFTVPTINSVATSIATALSYEVPENNQTQASIQGPNNENPVKPSN